MIEQFQDHVEIMGRAVERLNDPDVPVQEKIATLRVIESLARYQRERLAKEVQSCE